jgi:3'-phosphoadenosine 5'-phosphosulfate sulfotransferase (PAPS reductase)/FAD synthetase
LANILSLSGGKDSTAMLHVCLERGIKIDAVVFFDTGWDFPQMYDHLELVERKTGIKIEIIKPKKPFDYWMFEREIIARKGPMKGLVYRVGYGWPHMFSRWCTRLKIDTLDRYSRQFDNSIQLVGFAADEMRRKEKTEKNSKIPTRFPLVESGITESMALEICKSQGYNWGGLYDIFDRVSCYCCPLQGKKSLRKLRLHFPNLWEKILEKDAINPKHNRGFIGYETAHDLEEKFTAEENQSLLAIGDAING